MKNNKNWIIEYSLILILFTIGFYLRYTNLFFEDYWVDEIIGFGQADPNISIKETLERNIFKHDDRSEQTPILFHLLIKYFYKFFGYNPDIGKIFTFILGLAALPFAYLTTKEINAKKSSYLLIFLISTNIYLINYSQEVRPYILLFFMSFVNIYTFFKVLNNYFRDENSHIWNIIFIIVNILGFLTHPFFLIIIVSEFSYCLIRAAFFKEKLYKILILLTLSFVFSLIIQYEYILSLIKLNNYWISGPDIEFFLDFFFPRFFGSKIMGAVYFVTLISMIYIYRRRIFFDSKYLVFVLIIFFSYFLPTLYGFIRMPILHDRYIIFVIIPILIIISVFIYEIKNVKIRLATILILCLSTSGNLFLEIKNKISYKPELKKLTTSIVKLSEEGYEKNIFINEEKNPPYLYNYLTKFTYLVENNFNFLKKDENLQKNEFWMICYEWFIKNASENENCLNFDPGNKLQVKKVLKVKKIVGKYYAK